jgi:hypothetical protein
MSAAAAVLQDQPDHLASAQVGRRVDDPQHVCGADESLLHAGGQDCSGLYVAAGLRRRVHE